jgi:prolyl oligopeptidase
MEQQHLAPAPVARRMDLVDDYFGTKVADPYRWLEDPDSSETRAWVAAQNARTFGYLAHIPERGALAERLLRLWDYEKFGLPFQRGGRYFMQRNDGLQNQAVLYAMDGLDAPARVLLDPNTLSDDGTVALGGLAPSEDGSRIAYALASAGSDWIEWKVRDVTTGEDLPDRIRWSKFSGAAWAKDGSGFYYCRYPEPVKGEELEQANFHQKLYFHRLGDDADTDALIYERPDEKEWMFNAHVTEDGRYLILAIHKDTGARNAVFYKDLDAPAAPFVELLPGFEAEYDFIGNDGGVFLFQTNADAPRGRVVAVDTARPAPGEWKEIVGEAPETLRGVGWVHDTLIAVYLKDARTEVRLFAPDGTFRKTLPMPGLGTAFGFGGRRSDAETFYSYTDFTTPPAVYRYDFTSGESELFRQPSVDFRPDAYETRQVFYTGKDGVRVPMFITHKKGLVPDGTHRALLYGYGGFGASMTPSFSVANLVWMEQGGVYAMPCLRGGGEYGEDWHQAGVKLRKQNVFDDFIAAAEFLIAEGYTSSARLAISGGSNGGLLVGACLTQRPDLFGAALPAVGVLDMLRYHKFTIGWAWASDYGTSEDPQEFAALLAYSPLHNVHPGTAYPPTLITTGDHDDRVVPAHSFKFAAALQAAQGGDAPVLIRIETRAGHGAGKPTAKIIEEAADKLAFVLAATR